MIQEQISLVKVRNGEDGENGLTSYVHVAWANSSDGRKDFSLTESLGKKYEGTYTDFTEGASTDPSKYKWIESANVFREEIDEAKQAGYEANDKAYEAKIEAESASDNANNAVSKANDASADAGFAKTTANEAKQSAANAIEKANETGEYVDTQITQQNGKLTSISSKVGGNTTAIGKLESSYDGLNSTVAKVQNDFDELDINDRNLLPNTSDEWEEATFGGWTSGKEVIAIKDIGLSPGDTFTYTVEIDNTRDQKNTDNVRGLISFRTDDGTKLTQRVTKEVKTGKIERVSFTAKIPEKTAMLWVYRFSKTETGKTKTFAARKHKLQKGNRATDWTPAPEDTATVEQFSNLEQNLSGFKTTVQNEKADKTTVTQLADQWQQTTDLVDGHTSQISSLGDNINLRVKKNDVINQINISDESILIDSAKTHITGKTTIEEGVIDTAYIKDAAITSAKIKDITADKIKAGEVSGLILTSLSETGRFSVEGQHATLENTDTGWKTDIYDNGIYTYNPDHSLRARFTEDMVNSNKFGTSTYNVYLATGGLDGVEGESAGGEVRAVLYTQNIEDGEDVGSKYEYTYRPFRGEGMVGSYVNLNTAIPGSNNMYLRVPSGKEVKITRIGTVDDFQDIRAKDGYFASIMQESSDAGNFYIGANGEVRMTSRSGYNGGNTVYRDIRAQDARIASILQKDSGTNFYLGTGGKLRVTSRAGYNDGDTKYKAVQASGFENKSIVDIKTDITKRQEKALTCVNAADVYNYKFKDDVSRGITKNHIGLIIGDGYNTPDCVKNDDGTAIDVYAMTSVAWKAIQELSDKNETLNNRISDLQSEIDILRKETTI